MNSLVLLSGGIGTRMHNNIPKQYMLLAGKPIIMHTLERMDEIKNLKEVIIVCDKSYISNISFMIEQYNVKTPIRFAEAGKTRQESVLSGLKMVTTDNVIIHEAARPFVKVEDFNELIDIPETNAIYGAPIPFTVIRGGNYVEGLLNRSELVNVQLPQKFETKLLLDSHIKAAEEKMIFTEDASLVYYYYPSVKIRIIEGKEYDIKITTPTDLITGEQIYKEYFSGRR